MHFNSKQYSKKAFLQVAIIFFIISLFVCTADLNNPFDPLGKNFILPDVPISISASADDAKATVSFSAPTPNGGPVITAYTVTSSPGSITATGNGSPILISGLTNGTEYTFTVSATNAKGTGPKSAPSAPVIPGTVPGVPTGVSATAGNAQAVVSFSAPASDGGFTITGYTALSTPGGYTSTGTSSPLTVTGLTNGVLYTFTVTATNLCGKSPSSIASAAIIPSADTNTPIIYIKEKTITLNDSQPSDTIVIKNFGVKSLLWSATNVNSWLKINPSSDTIQSDSSSIIVNANLDGLEFGKYYDTIDIIYNGGNVKIPVLLIVTNNVVTDTVSDEIVFIQGNSLYTTDRYGRNERLLYTGNVNSSGPVRWSQDKSSVYYGNTAGGLSRILKSGGLSSVVLSENQIISTLKISNSSIKDVCQTGNNQITVYNGTSSQGAYGGIIFCSPAGIITGSRSGTMSFGYINGIDCSQNVIILQVYKLPQWYLAYMNTDGTNVRSLTIQRNGQNARFSNRGDRIVYNDLENDGIAIIDTTGGNQIQLTASSLTVMPVWSQDDKYILYLKKHIIDSLFIIKTDGTQTWYLPTSKNVVFSYAAIYDW